MRQAYNKCIGSDAIVKKETVVWVWFTYLVCTNSTVSAILDKLRTVTYLIIVPENVSTEM